MKNVARIPTQVVGVGLALIACSLWLTVQGAEGSARVTAVRVGSAQKSADAVTWDTVNAGDSLAPGTTVRTDAMGIVDLNLGKCGDYLRLTPGTTLRLTTLSYEQGAGETVVNTELYLSTGRIQGHVRKLSAASRFEVKTPVATYYIRGTRYEISATGRATVLEGLIEVLYTPAGATAPTRFDVPAGYTFEPSENSGRGGTLPTPAFTQEQIDQDLRELRGGAPAEEKVQVWVPMPTWEIVDRPFEPAPGLGDAKPFRVPPVFNPTTAVAPLSPPSPAPAL